MKIFDKIFGKPLTTAQQKNQKLSILTGVGAIGLDAFASIAYGPEAALLILLPAGLLGLHYFSIIMIFIVIVLTNLYLSYRQTIAAYPNDSGAYTVASKNLGKKIGIWAAISLFLDYLLNVAVGISAGIGALVSAFPFLQPYTVLLCLLILLTLTILNLRGVRETGLAFIIPTCLFIFCLATCMLIAFIRAWKLGGHIPMTAALSSLPARDVANVGWWLLIAAFANGLTAMTGVEAVSNAVPLFRKPAAENAQWTLTIIVGVLALFLLALTYLCPTYHILAMHQNQPGYQTILSQLVAISVGRGFFYYFTILSIFSVLIYSAQTSFIAFPRVCHLLAEDNFLPHFFAEQGKRLVFSLGIIMLGLFAAFLLIIFGGITTHLIPLFAVGAFSAFLFSQTGMVVHWIRHKKNPKVHMKLFLNALGAITAFISLMIILIVKFTHGAWIVVIAAILFALLFTQIKRHYRKISRAIENPLELQTSKLVLPIVIIPIQGWNRVAEKAVRFGILLSDNVTAVYISVGKKEEDQKIRELWKEKVEAPAQAAGLVSPKLAVITSHFRRIYQPILDYVNKTKKENPNHIVAVIIPELVEPHWYQHLLHNIHAAGLRTLLFLARDQRTVVITTPWYLK